MCLVCLFFCQSGVDWVGCRTVVMGQDVRRNVTAEPRYVCFVQVETDKTHDKNGWGSREREREREIEREGERDIQTKRQTETGGMRQRHKELVKQYHIFHRKALTDSLSENMF